MKFLRNWIPIWFPAGWVRFCLLRRWTIIHVPVISGSRHVPPPVVGGGVGRALSILFFRRMSGLGVRNMERSTFWASPWQTFDEMPNPEHEPRGGRLKIANHPFRELGASFRFGDIVQSPKLPDAIPNDCLLKRTIGNIVSKVVANLAYEVQTLSNASADHSHPASNFDLRTEAPEWGIATVKEWVGAC